MSVVPFWSYHHSQANKGWKKAGKNSYKLSSKDIENIVNNKANGLSIDVKNLQVFSIPKKTTLKLVVNRVTYVLVSVAFLTALVSGAGYFANKVTNSEVNTSAVQYDESYSAVTEKIFQAGEHLVKIPLDNKTIEEIKQYDTYEGYKLEGIFEQNTETAYIKYVNVEPVKCKVTHYDENGNYLYLEFGNVVELENTKIK